MMIMRISANIDDSTKIPEDKEEIYFKDIGKREVLS